MIFNHHPFENYMYTDKHLLKSLQAKDIEAYRFIYKQYSAALWGLILKEQASNHLNEALLQSVYISIWHNIKHYNPENCRLFTWMYQMVQTEIRNIQTLK